jgi:hypothetical protein
MSEELYGVAVSWRENYDGRDPNGVLKTTSRFAGVLMTHECAEALCKILKPKYPNVQPVELLRYERDEIAAKSLEELGEAVGLDKLTLVIQQCLNQGFSGNEILLKCKNAVESSEARIAKQKRIRELEAEAASLRSS